MTTPSPSNDRRHARRVLVTLVITTAAAAVTAGVVLKKHPPAEAAAQSVDANAARTGVAAATAAFPRRVEWRDPWKRPAPGSDSAAPSIHDGSGDGATRSDPSVPSAAAALERAAETSEEPATF
jgi:hypothetical protein